MSATYTPRRDGGGMLHFPSPTHLQHVDSTSALAQLRRSLSRSPSKSPAFRILTSKSASPSPSSPLSPSSRYQDRTGSAPLLPHTSLSPSPLASPLPHGLRKYRSGVRRLSPPGALSRSASLHRSPAKKALSDCTDNGNATSTSPVEFSAGAENASPTTSPDDTYNGGCYDSYFGRKTSDDHLSPHHAISRRDTSNQYFSDYPPKSSPLKRGDGIMNFDQLNTDHPSAKRRSLHGVSVSPVDSDMSDQEGGALAQDQQQTQTDNANETSTSDPATFLEHSGMFSALPKRTSSLRKTTLQQRGKLRPGNDVLAAINTPGVSSSKARQRMSLDNAFPPVPRESPFSSQGALPSASIHPLPSQRKDHQFIGGPLAPQRHPLSRTITQSSSSSSVSEDSPTHLPIRYAELRKSSVDFSKSLPGGTTLQSTKGYVRTGGSNGDGSSSGTSFATPENYKLAKPLPAAFMSTGLISKRNKDININQIDLNDSIGAMPDTPCKRPTAVAAAAPDSTPSSVVSKPRQRQHSIHSFGTPSTPFNPHVSRPSLGNFAKGTSIFGSSYGNHNVSRRGSLAAVDSEENSQSSSANVDSQSSTDLDLPPTPTKQVLGSNVPHHHHRLTQSESSNLPHAVDVPEPLENASPRSEPFSSPLFDRLGPRSPQTPQGSMLPPDPSGLSISAHGDGHAIQNFGSSLFLPATPTASRDRVSLFGKSGLSVTPVHGPNFAEVDGSLLSKFKKVEIIGSGEFSQVFRVTQRSNSNATASYFTLPKNQTSPETPMPHQVWAVKKSRNAYIGPKDRQRKLHEVEVLKALGRSDHTVELVDHWEHNDHLYIQTEYCEEGSLDLFLDRVGRNARLDDFRIWKIMLELSLGLKHIHGSGFMHLDLKPANVLITFEGVLKIGDFGLASSWPAQSGIDGEGDREYIGPEILLGQYDKPADIFALGLIMLEIAGNVMLPDNGASWQRLRSGDMSDVPSLTSSSEASWVLRDSSGKPISPEESESSFEADEFGSPTVKRDSQTTTPNPKLQLLRYGELSTPPVFMTDPDHEEALDNMVRRMISPNPADRPVVEQILATGSLRWTESRRRAGATVYEGNWGPADEVLQDDAEMIDV